MYLNVLKMFKIKFKLIFKTDVIIECKFQVQNSCKARQALSDR